VTDQAPFSRVAVLGGGISGLAAALRLANSEKPVEVTVFETALSPGGLVRTEHRDGFLIECGPDSFITNKPAGLELCKDLGVEDQLIPTCSRWRRSLVLHGGRPCDVPEGFMLMAPGKLSAVLATPILSLPGKLRLLSEYFVRRRRSSGDESLEDFVVRRFGTEVFERLVQPLVGGIYTADPRRLSLSATLPRFIQMEQEYGSIIRAMQKQKRREKSGATDEATAGSGARYGLFATHRDGLGALVQACEESCLATGRVTIRYGQRIGSIRPCEDSGCQWHLRVRGESESRQFDAIIGTLPTYRMAAVMPDPRFADFRSRLEQFEYASSAIVVTAHKLADFQHPLDAFGLVIPECERRRILAVSFSSRKFEGRAPEDSVLLRTFVGGAMHPELLDRDDSEIEKLVCDELRDLLGLQAEPQFAMTVRYNKAMPQYHVGHEERVRALKSELEQFPGLYLAGNAYSGVGLPDSIGSAREAADKAIAVL